MIFYFLHSNKIKNMISNKLDPYVLDPIELPIYINFYVLINFIKSLKYIDKKLISGSNSFFRMLGKIVYRSYILGVLKTIDPKVIVSLIDNCSLYHWIHDKYRSAEVISIQNGLRTLVEKEVLKVPYNLNHFFTFGDYEKDFFIKSIPKE